MVKALFYLPVVTPWWLDNIVAPLIEIIRTECSVEAIVPSPWRGTGVPPTHPTLARFPDVNWYFLEGERYHATRLDLGMTPNVLDLVHEIDADYTFCRSADVVTPNFFPGIVRFLMEHEIPPLPRGDCLSLTGPRLFDRGFLPPMVPEVRTWLADVATDLLETNSHRHPRNMMADWRARLNIPDNRRVIAFPLEFEFPENFFATHRLFENNVATLNAILPNLDESCLLAVTRHPLNRQFGGDEQTVTFLAAHRDRIVEVVGTDDGGPTEQLILQCDGVVLEDTKCVYLAAYHGKPILHASRFECDAWMGVYKDVQEFVEAMKAGSARVPARSDVLAWFGYGIVNDRIDLRSPDLRWDDLRNRANHPYDPRRWIENLNFYQKQFSPPSG